jgi:H+-transporting ATPase
MQCKLLNLHIHIFVSFDEYSDSCVLDSFGKADSIDETIIVKSFLPFDPTTKRTEVTYQMKSSLSMHRVTKGMPDAILPLCTQSSSRSSDEREKVRSNVNEFAKRGLRSLAVAIADDDKNFRLIGLLPIFDPPREDTRETIMKAIELGNYTVFLFHKTCLIVLPHRK